MDVRSSSFTPIATGLRHAQIVQQVRRKGESGTASRSTPFAVRHVTAWGIGKTIGPRPQRPLPVSTAVHTKAIAFPALPADRRKHAISDISTLRTIERNTARLPLDAALLPIRKEKGLRRTEPADDFRCGLVSRALVGPPRQDGFASRKNGRPRANCCSLQCVARLPLLN